MSRQPAKNEISREILAYLQEHPDAQDTLEGIIQWWLLERGVKHQKTTAKEALDELVAKGLVLVRRREDQEYYCLNHRKETKGRL